MLGKNNLQHKDEEKETKRHTVFNNVLESNENSNQETCIKITP